MTRRDRSVATKAPADRRTTTAGDGRPSQRVPQLAVGSAIFGDQFLLSGPTIRRPSRYVNTAFTCAGGAPGGSRRCERGELGLT